MKNEKLRKILIILAIIVLVIVVLFLIHTFRNFVIIKTLQNNVEKYVASTNYHVKSITTEDKSTRTVNYYKKDGKQAMIMEIDRDGEVSKQLMYNNGERTDIFYDTPQEKTVQLDSGVALWLGEISNYLQTDNDWQTFIASMQASIKTTEYNGKKCYIINNFPTSMVMDGEEKNEYYIEKDTGLLVKSNIDSTITEKEYEFDNVSDEVFTEPDVGQYKIQDKK